MSKSPFMSKSPLRRTAAMVCALMVAGAAGASEPAPVAARSGGVSTAELAELERHAADYSLKLILAAEHSGAYLADVDVVVRSLPTREMVLEHRAAGPLLLAALPPGHYELTASCGAVLPGAPDKLARTFSIAPSGATQMVVYFDTGDTLSPESPPAYSLF